MNWDAVMWLCLIIVFLWLESSTVLMVSLWFAVGAFAALVASLFGAQLWIQTLLFVAVSAVLLALLRRVFKAYIQPKIVKTNLDSVIDSTGYVTARIDNPAGCGQVKLGAMEWTARSTSGDPIAEGTLVKVDRIEGVKLFVTPAEVPSKV